MYEQCFNGFCKKKLQERKTKDKGRRREEEEREKKGKIVLRVRSIRSVGDLVAALSRVPSIREAGVLGKL